MKLTDEKRKYLENAYNDTVIEDALERIDELEAAAQDVIDAGNTLATESEAIVAILVGCGEFKAAEDPVAAAKAVAARLEALRKERDALASSLISASHAAAQDGARAAAEEARANKAEAERDEARKSLAEMHRRAQAAESIVKQSGIVENREQDGLQGRRPLGRVLANYAAAKATRERDEARAELARLKAAPIDAAVARSGAKDEAVRVLREALEATSQHARFSSWLRDQKTADMIDAALASTAWTVTPTTKPDDQSPTTKDGAE